ncbi:uncharacterized protein LOC112592449 [Melanaphis sacchari]|uniref:uncharacterized protein LOC112592449 n=1 Tax=Melanaphis sacchari TaxID=742174 RepID=UPI000DC1528D|nr:uncharacterized protein LOC112592449 [Melanaphis sacchari]
MSCYSVKSDDEEECFSTSDVEIMEPEIKSMTKLTGQKRKDVKNRKTLKKKPKKNISYQEKVTQLIQNEKIAKDVMNSITIRQSGGVVTIKSVADEKCTDYWTLAHYKTKNIEHIDVKDRWKHAECSLKLAITDQSKDQNVLGELNEIVQTLFDRFMKDPKKKIIQNVFSK